MSASDASEDGSERYRRGRGPGWPWCLRGGALTAQVLIVSVTSDEAVAIGGGTQWLPLLRSCIRSVGEWPRRRRVPLQARRKEGGREGHCSSPNAAPARVPVLRGVLRSSKVLCMDYE